jgi:hypothetical protein
MKKFTFLLTFILLLLLTNSGMSQVTNLTVNGSSNNFTMTSGDPISWSYNVPKSGDSTFIQIWYDVNGNGIIDAGDVLYQSLGQVDGDTLGILNGPPDMNNTPGAVSFSQAVGIAPGKYVLKFIQNNIGETIAGTVNQLSSPAHYISGTVTPPAGKSAAHIFVEASRKEKYQPNFWDAITDANGNYSIAMNSDTAGNPWVVSLVRNPFPPNIVTPQEDSIKIIGNPSSINFSFITAASQVAGTLMDENGNPLSSVDVSLNRIDSVNSISNVGYRTTTNINGLYQIGIKSEDLISGRPWSLYATTTKGDFTGSTLAANYFFNSIASGDSIYKNLIIYNANSYISGTLKINGSAPGFPIEIIAQNDTMAQAATMCDASTGNFTLSVTNKINNYDVFPIFYPSTYYFGQNVIAHPGDTGINLNLSITGIENKVNTFPKQFSLGQNYPNPFNPTTTIQYEVPISGLVNLTVYNILGQKVAELVNKVQATGKYEVQFNADRLSSGVYFYKLSAGSYTNTKKMILLK